MKNAAFDARGVEARLDLAGFQWASTSNAISLTAPSVRLQAAAASVMAGQIFTAPKLDVTARKVRFASADGSLDADVSAIGSAGLDAALAPLRAADPVLANAIRQNLARLALAFAGHVERRSGVTRFALTQPLLVTGAKGGTLRVPALALSGGSDSLKGALEASLKGGPASRRPGDAQPGMERRRLYRRWQYYLGPVPHSHERCRRRSCDRGRKKYSVGSGGATDLIWLYTT